MVGQLGTQQLSAVSLASTALSSCTLLFSFLLFLTVPEVAAAAAKKDSDQVGLGAWGLRWLAPGGRVYGSGNGLGGVAGFHRPGHTPHKPRTTSPFALITWWRLVGGCERGMGGWVWHGQCGWLPTAWVWA